MSRSRSPTLPARLQQLRRHPMARWLASGLAFMGVTAVLLYLFVDLAGLSVPVGTLLVAEVATVLQYFVNEYWVFGTRSPGWLKLGQFHLANAGATAIWWVAANALDQAGLHHTVAALLAVGCSTGIKMAFNFLWIWRRPGQPASPP